MYEIKLPHVELGYRRQDQATKLKQYIEHKAKLPTHTHNRVHRAYIRKLMYTKTGTL